MFGPTRFKQILIALVLILMASAAIAQDAITVPYRADDPAVARGLALVAVKSPQGWHEKKLKYQENKK